LVTFELLCRPLTCLTLTFYALATWEYRPIRAQQQRVPSSSSIPSHTICFIPHPRALTLLFAPANPIITFVDGSAAPRKHVLIVPEVRPPRTGTEPRGYPCGSSSHGCGIFCAFSNDQLLTVRRNGTVSCATTALCLHWCGVLVSLRVRSCINFLPS
jgi:hypothetical protein